MSSAPRAGLGLDGAASAGPGHLDGLRGTADDDPDDDPFLESDDGSVSDASTAESAFSLPQAEVRIGGYMQLIGEAAGAADRLDASVGAIMALRRSLNASSAVPQNVARRLTVVSAQLYRSAAEACLSVTELSRLAVRFTRGLIVSEELGRLQAEVDRRGAERDAARLRALEAERKCRVTAAALQRWRGDIASFRWQRVITKALSRQTLRVVQHRLAALRTRITRQGRMLQVTRERLATAKRVLAIAAEHDACGALRPIRGTHPCPVAQRRRLV